VAKLFVRIPGGKRWAPGKIIVALFCLSLLLLGPLTGAYGREVPDYHGYVNDYAAMLSPEAREKLERVLSSYDLSDSTQVAILTIDSLEGDQLEDFSIRVVDKWKIGQKEKDNGVLFLVVKNDRKMRIEVGRGLEHVLTDLAAGRIIDRVVTPLFRAGHFDEGFEAGTEAIIQTTRGEYSADTGKRGRGEPPRFFKYLLFGMLLMIFLASSSKILGAAGGAVLLPLITFMGLPGSVAWIVLLLLVPVGAFAGLLLSSILTAMPGHGGIGRRGGFYTGSGFGGLGGGGFGGFGGGGFGGGGASGGW